MTGCVCDEDPDDPGANVCVCGSEPCPGSEFGPTFAEAAWKSKSKLRELSRLSQEFGGYDGELGELTDEAQKLGLYGDFRKLDDGKPDFALLPLSGLKAWAEVLTYGEKKYSRGNWRKAGPEDEPRLRKALLRHALEYSWDIETGGDGLDKESGLSHLGHMMANIGFLIDLAERGKK